MWFLLLVSINHNFRMRLVVLLSCRLHRGKSGRSSSRWNNKSRSTSRAPPWHKAPSDRQVSPSGHLPMNVALPTGIRPDRTKGDRPDRPAAAGSKPKNFFQGEMMEPQAEELWVHCQLGKGVGGGWMDGWSGSKTDVFFLIKQTLTKRRLGIWGVFCCDTKRSHVTIFLNLLI